jgi:Fe/S biogenesis protein NfuA
MVQSVEKIQAAGLVSVTDEARQIVLEALNAEPDPQTLALWLEVRGVQAGAFAYDLYFQAARDAGEDDSVQHSDDLTVVVPAGSVDRLRGARLEWSQEGEGGLVLVNPNAPTPAEAAPGVPAEVLEAGIDGAVAVEIITVLEHIINPSIAGHGGRADLVGFDEDAGVAYLRLSGGCQGCAMSRMTLSQGIEAALREEVPQVTGVIDVTDHDGGLNPYY